MRDSEPTEYGIRLLELTSAVSNRQPVELAVPFDWPVIFRVGTRLFDS